MFNPFLQFASIDDGQAGPVDPETMSDVSNDMNLPASNPAAAGEIQSNLESAQRVGMASKPPMGTAEILQGNGESTAFSNQETQNQFATELAREEVFPRMPRGPRGPGNEMMPEGLDYLRVGPDGKSDFKRALVDGPQLVGQALDQGAEAEAQQHQALQGHYQSEQARQAGVQATMEARRQSDDTQIAKRQQELDNQITQYSNDLSNQGKFWQNPGNIIAAIAFSLMPINSNDPAVGIKLINQAIDRDMANRKSQADMHLGELRSNLGEYRKVAGDKRVGDLLAESEAKRIAALEIDRIGQKYASPIAQAKKEALKQNFLMQSVQAKMAAYQQYHIYNDAKAVDPRYAKALKAPGQAGVEGAWSPFGETGPAPKGTIGGTPSTATDVPLPKGMSKAQASALASRPDEAAKQALSGSLPPNSLESIYKAAVANDVYSRAKGTPGTDGFAQSYNDLLRGREELAQKSASEIARTAVPYQDGMILSRNVIRDMQMIETAAQARGEDVNKFLRSMRDVTGGGYAARINDLRQKYGTANTPEAKAQMDSLAASERLHRLLAADIADYKHGLLGGAQSEQELEGFKQIVNNADSWGALRNYVNMRNQQWTAKHANAVNTAADPVGKLLYLRSVSKYGATMDTNGPPRPNR